MQKLFNLFYVMNEQLKIKNADKAERIDLSSKLSIIFEFWNMWNTASSAIFFFKLR